jgi:glycosyltransferase involved in cell wall biosynthesis
MEINKQEPKISVIIPTYNREKVLPRAVKSALNQTFKDFEILVVDDGSTDNTQEVVEDLQKKDERIKYFRYTPNQGGNVARNLGIKKSQGDYIAFLDSDDEWLPESLEERIKFFDTLSDEYGLVYCQSIKKILKKEQVVPKRGIKENESIVEYLFEGEGNLQTSSIIVRKNILEKDGLFFDEELKRHQDWDFVIRLRKYAEFYFLKKPLTVWHAEDAYKKLTKKFDESSSLRFIEKHQKDFNDHPKALAEFQWNLATKCLRSGRLKKGRELLKESNKNNSNIKKSLLYYFSFLGKTGIKALTFVFNLKNRFSE